MKSGGKEIRALHKKWIMGGERSGLRLQEKAMVEMNRGEVWLRDGNGRQGGGNSYRRREDR